MYISILFFPLLWLIFKLSSIYALLVHFMFCFVFFFPTLLFLSVLGTVISLYGYKAFSVLTLTGIIDPAQLIFKDSSDKNTFKPFDVLTLHLE